MRTSRQALGWLLVLLVGLAGCAIYSPYGAQTSGASTFSVEDFEPAHPLVSATAAQSLSEALRDRVQRQRRCADGRGGAGFPPAWCWNVRRSTCRERNGGANRVSVQLVLNYVNERDPS